MGYYSRHACDDGLRVVTDAFCDRHRNALTAALVNGSITIDAETVQGIFGELGLPLPRDWSDEAIKTAAGRVAAEMLASNTPNDECYTAGLRAVGQALDEYVDAAAEEAEARAREQEHEHAYEVGYDDGLQAGREEAAEEAEALADEAAEARGDALKCPTCCHDMVRPEHTPLDGAHNHGATCGNCSTPWRLVSADYLARLARATVELHTVECSVTRADYERRCGLESAPLSAGEER